MLSFWVIKLFGTFLSSISAWPMYATFSVSQQRKSKVRSNKESHSEIHFQKLVLLGEQWGNHVWIGETLWMRADYCSCLTPQGDGELLDSIVVHYGSSGCVNSRPLSQSWYDKTVPASSRGSASSPPPHTHTKWKSHLKGLILEWGMSYRGILWIENWKTDGLRHALVKASWARCHPHPFLWHYNEHSRT